MFLPLDIDKNCCPCNSQCSIYVSAILVLLCTSLFLCSTVKIFLVTLVGKRTLDWFSKVMLHFSTLPVSGVQKNYRRKYFHHAPYCVS